MSENKFTPGPWSIEWDYKNGQAVVQGARLDGDVNGYGLGDVVAIDVADDNLTVHMFPPLSPESCANAHMIAASRDMYEALEMVWPWVEVNYEFGDMMDHDDQQELMDIHDKIKAVMAKARGETQ